jgi:hypothetical protein
MKIPKYWGKGAATVMQPGGQKFQTWCWQWSDTSTEDARQKADARAGELIRKLLTGSELGRYPYGVQPLREEITQGIKTQAGKEVAVVTRNAYGSLVLNAANAMFIDIDFSKKDIDALSHGRMPSLFAAKGPSLEERYAQPVAIWAAQHPDLGVRIYRTYGGLRCLITNQVFDPTSAQSTSILQALSSDPLYMRLCQAQECYRARLSPKPWRCGIGQPPARFPWENVRQETGYRKWQQSYEATAAHYSTCKFIKQIGASDIHPDIAPILDLHDRLTCPVPSRNLA